MVALRAYTNGDRATARRAAPDAVTANDAVAGRWAVMLRSS
jgi:hypothetical protein